MGIILAFLFSSMQRSSQLETKIETARTHLLERQHLQARLQDLFLSMTKLYTKRFPKEKCDSLVMTFDNGIDPEPHFSGQVLGRIFLDEQKNLCLGLWPIEKINSKNPWRKEILFSQVENFAFSFFENTPEIDKKHLWTAHWKQETRKLPCMARLSLSQKENPLVFAFFLPSATSPIVYQSRGISR